MANNLFNLPTACAAPEKVAGRTWDRLDTQRLACLPDVAVPEPMVTVATGDTVRLGCVVSENPSGSASLKWVHTGVVVRDGLLCQVYPRSNRIYRVGLPLVRKVLKMWIWEVPLAGGQQL